jgi:hypothetical protein
LVLRHGSARNKRETECRGAYSQSNRPHWKTSILVFWLKALEANQLSAMTLGPLCDHKTFMAAKLSRYRHGPDHVEPRRLHRRAARHTRDVNEQTNK